MPRNCLVVKRPVEIPNFYVLNKNKPILERLHEENTKPTKVNIFMTFSNSSRVVEMPVFCVIHRKNGRYVSVIISLMLAPFFSVIIMPT